MRRRLIHAGSFAECARRTPLYNTPKDTLGMLRWDDLDLFLKLTDLTSTVGREAAMAVCRAAKFGGLGECLDGHQIASFGEHQLIYHGGQRVSPDTAYPGRPSGIRDPGQIQMRVGWPFDLRPLVDLQATLTCATAGGATIATKAILAEIRKAEQLFDNSAMPTDAVFQLSGPPTYTAPMDD